jgi:hypothetical protein
MKNKHANKLRTCLNAGDLAGAILRLSLLIGAIMTNSWGLVHKSARFRVISAVICMIAAKYSDLLG